LHHDYTLGRVRVLLSYNANPNIRNNNEKTPLMVYRNMEAIELLVKAGADPNIQDNHGNTILHYSRLPQCVRLMLSFGADPNIQNKDGKTPLHLRILRELRDRIMINHQTAQEISATPLPRSPGNLESIQLLMAAGADPEIRDKEGVTPPEMYPDAELRQLVLQGRCDRMQVTIKQKQ
jgi:cytohesin